MKSLEAEEDSGNNFAAFFLNVFKHFWGILENKTKTFHLFGFVSDPLSADRKIWIFSSSLHNTNSDQMESDGPTRPGLHAFLGADQANVGCFPLLHRCPGVVYPSLPVSLSLFGAGSPGFRELVGLEAWPATAPATVIPERMKPPPPLIRSTGRVRLGRTW